MPAFACIYTLPYPRLAAPVAPTLTPPPALCQQRCGVVLVPRNTHTFAYLPLPLLVLQQPSLPALPCPSPATDDTALFVGFPCPRVPLDDWFVAITLIAFAALAPCATARLPPLAATPPSLLAPEPPLPSLAALPYDYRWLVVLVVRLGAALALRQRPLYPARAGCFAYAVRCLALLYLWVLNNLALYAFFFLPCLLLGNATLLLPCPPCILMYAFTFLLAF